MRRRLPVDCGTSLLEQLAALTLLGFVLVSSYTVIDRARAHRRQVEERLHVLHAIEKEIEAVRALPVRRLTLQTDAPFVSMLSGSEPTELASLAAVEATTSIVATAQPGLRRLTVRVAWGHSRRHTEVGEVLLVLDESAGATP